MTSTPAIELKPCPFCGSPAQSTQWTGRMADDCFPHYSIHCTNGEDCWGSNHANLGSDLAETVAAWNRRSLDRVEAIAGLYITEHLTLLATDEGNAWDRLRELFAAMPKPAVGQNLLPIGIASRPACTAEVVVKAEPVAWEGYWPGAGSINSQTVLTRFRSTMERWEKDGAEITPLYASPPSPAQVTEARIVASAMRLCAKAEGAYGFMDMSSNEAKENWAHFGEAKVELLKLTTDALAPSPAQSAIVPPVVEVTEAMVEAAARAMCTRHYAQRFRKLEADEHVMSNVDANWHLFRDDALAALQAQHRGE
jgi:hypothetical protein